MTDKEAIEELKARKEHYEMGDGCEFLVEALEKGIEALENQKSVIDVLDKIRAEIEHLTITEGGEDYTRKMAELYSLKIKVLQIIDKYKAESE